MFSIGICDVLLFLGGVGGGTSGILSKRGLIYSGTGDGENAEKQME